MVTLPYGNLLLAEQSLVFYDLSILQICYSTSSALVSRHSEDYLPWIHEAAWPHLAVCQGWGFFPPMFSRRECFSPFFVVCEAACWIRPSFLVEAHWHPLKLSSPQARNPNKASSPKNAADAGWELRLSIESVNAVLRDMIEARPMRLQALRFFFGGFGVEGLWLGFRVQGSGFRV